MRQMLLAAIITVLVSLPLVTVAPVSAQNIGLPPVLAQSQGKALILSSVNRIVPLGYYSKVWNYELTHAGYQVTFLADSAVTLDVLLTQLNNYNIVIWRTNQYTFKHTDYYYVGQMLNSAAQQKYSTDLAQGWINGNAGILGVSADFFSHHFSSGTLGNVKLVVLISSNSNIIATYFINAGAKAVVSCNGQITLTFGLIDDVTGALLSNLASGNTVEESVYNTVAPYSKITPRDPLDSTYSPPFWFSGDGALKIT